VIPASVDGNIHHKYIRTSIGFDSASKVYSQLIGNMLTDSASAVKYWYFIRLMGKEPSHLALEAALKTCPNMVIVSEECNNRKETLGDIVNRICDTIFERSAQDKNYGCVLIPEGLLFHLSAYNQLIHEINTIFADAQKRIADGQPVIFSDEESDPDAVAELSQKLLADSSEIGSLLTPWSHSLFNSLPDFLKQQLLIERQLSGSIKLSQIETEKLVAYLVDEELNKRKRQGKYSGTFAPVTHFFGYQGRSGHPSMFDCSLGSTMGYTAAVLVQHKLTGLAVSITNVTQPAK